MGNNNLSKVEKNLRSIAKRYKTVKYSLGLAILFLMMGVSAFSEETVQEVPTNEQIGASRENLKNSVGNLQSKINVARKENEKELKGLKLELIQLMEQGDQVTKSNWSSWQFGTGYTYNEWSGKYKGLGDKEEKYIYQGIYTRGNWKVRNAMDIEGAHTGDRPITPGHENTSNWTNTNRATTVETVKKDKSINSGVNGNRDWGLVKLRNLKEPTNEVEILAKISPKDVFKEKLDIDVTVQTPDQIVAPVVKPNVNKPTEAPKVNLPKASSPQIPNEPTLNVSPTITVMKVNPVGNITVNPGNVTAVDFTLSPSGLSEDTTRKFSNRAYDLNGQNINVNNNSTGNKNYISTWGRVAGLDGVTTNVDVTVGDTRAFMIDEGIDYKDTTIEPFRYIGTITLKESKTVGIDVQGTHTNYSNAPNSVNPSFTTIDNVANIQVINDGKIIGEGATNRKNQVAFGFNNFDVSSNNTRTQMINRNIVTLDAVESVGIQLRPEDPNATESDLKRGLNMMTGENTGTISVNGYGSFGILTVKNKNLSKLQASPPSIELAQVKDYSNYKVRTSEGGQIASRADEGSQSAIVQEGKTAAINIQGDNSVGVGILNGIQSVKIGGNINIGTTAQTSNTYANNGADAAKVEGSVGVYTQEATRPVRGREFEYDGDGKPVFETDGVTHKLKTSYYDDHARENTKEETPTAYNYQYNKGNRY